MALNTLLTCFSKAIFCIYLYLFLDFEKDSAGSKLPGH